MRNARICCIVAMALIAVLVSTNVMARERGHDRWDRHDRRMEDFGESMGEMGERFGEIGERFGERWGRFGERMGEHWGEFGERTGERWGHFGERLGEHWGEFGEQFGESFAEGDYRSAEDAFIELDWDWIGTLVTEAIETTIDAVDAALDSFEDFEEVVH